MKQNPWTNIATLIIEKYNKKINWKTIYKVLQDINHSKILLKKKNIY